MEGSLHYPQRTIQTHHYVLWSQQLPCHIPALHEWLLLRHDCWRMACHLHGWPPHILPQWDYPHPKNLSDITVNKGTRPLSEIGEMLVCLLRSGVSQHDSQTWATHHGPSQTWWNHQLAHSYQSQGSMIFLRLCQLLLLLHSRLLHCGLPPPWPHQERPLMGLDSQNTSILRQLETTISIKTCPPTPQLH